MKPANPKSCGGSNAVAICRKSGLKVTRQRVVIIGEILKSRNHPDAETLYRRVKPRLPDLSLDTVYRTLRTLSQKGHIMRLSTPLDRGHFDPDLRPHTHFVCRRCSRIWDLPVETAPSRDLMEAAALVGQIERVQITGVGYCRDCAHDSERKPTP